MTETYFCKFEEGYTRFRCLTSSDIRQLLAQHMYRPSALALPIRKMCALHMSSMWTKATDPILVLTADSIEMNLESPVDVAKFTSYYVFITCVWYLHLFATRHMQHQLCLMQYKQNHSVTSFILWTIQQNFLLKSYWM